MHIYFGLAFGVFIAYLVKEFGFTNTFFGTLAGLASSGLVIVLAVLSYGLF